MRLPLTLAMLGVATAASAHNAPSRMLSDACRAEIVKLCPPHGDRAAFRQCMMANVDKVSNGCKTEMSKIRATRGRREGKGTVPAPTLVGNSMTRPPSGHPM